MTSPAVMSTELDILGAPLITSAQWQLIIHLYSLSCQTHCNQLIGFLSMQRICYTTLHYTIWW